MFMEAKAVLALTGMLFFSGAMLAEDNSEDKNNKLESAPKAPKLKPIKSTQLKRQAGIGSSLAYAEAGVGEFGGFITHLNADDYSETSLSPSFGYFLADNFQMSALLSWNRIEVEADNGDQESTSVGTAMLEPSLHVPFTNQYFSFIGLGLGGLFEEDQDPAFALAPRVGVKFLVGRSGLLNMTLQRLTSLDEKDSSTDQEGAVIVARNTTRLGVGYTVLF